MSPLHGFMDNSEQDPVESVSEVPVRSFYLLGISRE